jgi:hypothetical protein
VHQDEMVAIRKTWQNLAKDQFRYLKPVCVPQHQNAPMRREHRFEVNREDVGPAGLDGREPLWIDEAGDPWGDCRRPVVALTQTYDPRRPEMPRRLSEKRCGVTTTAAELHD